MKSLLKCILKKHYDRQLEADQNEFIETHYREVENMYQKMRGWRHDYHNHIQTLKFLAANNDIVGIREYLNELDTNLSILDSSIRTGNSMADAILNSKVSLAKAREIDVRVDAHIPVKLKISEIDLCCILGNLFDNAIDASMALPPQNRLIRVYMDMKQLRKREQFFLWAHPCLYGHEGQPALYLVHKFHLSKKARQTRPRFCNNKGFGTRPRAFPH